MRRLSLILMVVICSAGSIAAKDWRGILPLHSTGADVERLLGPATTTRHGLLSYELGEIEVLFLLAEKVLKDCPSIAEGIVLSIRVLPKVELSPNVFNVTDGRFRKFQPTEFEDSETEGYVNEEEGFVIRTFKGHVEEMVYLASAVDRPRCPGYYSDLQHFVTVRKFICGYRSKFDEYGDIRFSDEKARLDNFAIQLENTPDHRGYLVVYAGRKAVVAEAQLRGNRAKDYLVNVRKIEPSRIIVIDGGHMENLTVQLWALPPAVEPPESQPSVKAENVEIIYEKPKRRRRKN